MTNSKTIADTKSSTMKTAVLVYSGGLDTSVAIPLLRERYGCDRVITVVADVGQWLKVGSDKF